jgi:polygalacturonase
MLDGGGARWWGGKGSNCDVTKPKFFYAHSLTTSSITDLNIKNTPVQIFSVDGATLDCITIAGDTNSLGHNTDAFGIGGSTGVTVSGANVKN